MRSAQSSETGRIEPKAQSLVPFPCFHSYAKSFILIFAFNSLGLFHVVNGANVEQTAAVTASRADALHASEWVLHQLP